MLQEALMDPRGALLILARSTFVVAVIAAAAFDVRYRRIPNKVTAPLALLGLGVSGLAGGPHALTKAFLCLALGFAIWFPLYVISMLGAGDVKLFAAAAAWLTPSATLRGAVISGILGGVLAIVWMIRLRGIAFTMVRVAHTTRDPMLLRQPLPMPTGSGDARMPYGLAMSAALLVEASRLWLS